MTRPARIIIGMALLFVIGIGVAAGWLWFQPGDPAPPYSPTEVSSVSLPGPPEKLAWSPDGKYIAASASGPANAVPGKSEIFIVDVSKQAVVATVKAPGLVAVMAFTPDSKWLAVAANTWGPANMAFATELVVFDVPDFTAKFTAKAIAPADAFMDLAWSADSKALHAIDSENTLGCVPQFRRWTLPDFAEATAIKTDKPQNVFCKALAPSPDGLTLAVAEQTAAGHLVIRIYNLANAKEIKSFKVSDIINSPRLGFTADGKALGVLDGAALSWWNPETGQPASPGQPRFAVPPPQCPLSPDGNLRAKPYHRNRDFGDIGGAWDGRGNEYGSFIELTQSNPAKSWNWRVSSGEMPAVAFSPDGTKLAGTASGSIVIWAVPK